MMQQPSKWITLAAAVGAITLGLATAQAYNLNGRVICPNGTVYPGVEVIVTLNGNEIASTTTDQNGDYAVHVDRWVYAPDSETHVVSLNPATLPAGAVIPPPESISIPFAGPPYERTIVWSVDSEICDEGACWLTGGGNKIGDAINFGGNVYPGCSPSAGEGGNWTLQDKESELHFQGRSITVVTCGNVDGIPAGSTSPRTPFNFIEFTGTGILKGIGNNKSDYGEVSFYARCEDRSEPGSKESLGPDRIDRLYLRVYTGTTTLLLVSENEADPLDVAPVAITGGNLQIHISSCDNPPLVPVSATATTQSATKKK